MSNLLFPAEVRGLTFTVVKTVENTSILQESSSYASTRILQGASSRWHWRFEYSILFDNVLNPNPHLSYTDLQSLMGFCQARYSSYDDFLYSDPDANFVGPAVITSTWAPNFQYTLGVVIIASGHAQQVTSITGNRRSGFITPAFSTSGGTVVDGGILWADIGSATNSGTNWPNPQAQLQVVTDGTNFYSPVQRNVGGQSWEDITELASSLTVYDNGVLTTNYTLSYGGLAISGFSSNGWYLKWNAQPSGTVTATFSFYYRVRLEESITDFEKFVAMMWAMGGEQNVQGKGYLKLVTATPTSAPTFISASVPMPPIDFPSGATRVAVLYPTTVVNTGGFTDLSHATLIPAIGVAGINAYAIEVTPGIGVGFTGPSSTFSGYLLPASIPPGTVKAVYWYSINNKIPALTTITPRGTTTWSGGGTLNIPSFTGISIEITRMDSGLFPASSFPISSIQSSFGITGSGGASYSPPQGWSYAPRIVVYY